MDFLKYFKSIINELMPNWNVKILKHIEGKENIKSQFRISIGSRDFSIKFRNFIPRTRDQKIWFLKGMAGWHYFLGFFISFILIL